MDTRDYFERAADLVGLSPGVRRLLALPCDELTLHFPVKMDDESVETFRGFRVHHNDALGPYLGGLRYHPSVTLKAMRTQAAQRTWQAALAGLPFGGSMGGIQLDPSRHTLSELERITRRFVFALGNNIGPDYDVLTTEVNTNSQIMSWVLDTYFSTVPPQERNRAFPVVTGKPLEAGGLPGRNRAVGLGMAMLIERWAKDHGVDLAASTYTLQGFGTVGSSVARVLQSKGARLLAVEDVTGGVFHAGGIDAEDLFEYSRRHFGLRGYPRATALSHEAFLRTPATIFIPAALATGFTSELLELLNVRLVAEGACILTEPGMDEVLRRKGMDLLPDVLCTVGGATASYFEWLQNKRGERWELEEVEKRLQDTLYRAYERVAKASVEFGADWRTTSVALALKDLEGVYRDRGFFP